MKTSKNQHLSFWAVLIFIWRSIKEWWSLPFLLTFIPHFKPVVALIIGCIAIILWGFARYLAFTFNLTSDHLDVHSGILVRRHRHFPANQIQSLNADQQFWMRPLHIMSVTVETAGHGPEAKAKLPAVSQKTWQDLKTLKYAASADTPSNAKPDQPVYHLSSHDLLVFSASSLGIWAVLAGIYTVFNRVTDVLPRRTVDRAFSSIHSVLLWVGLAVFIVLLGFLISFLLIWQRYYGFQLTRDEQLLHAKSGLFNLSHFSLPVRRIQAVIMRANIVRQFLKLVTVEAVIATNAAKDEDDKNSTLIPVIRASQAVKIVHEFLPEYPSQAPQLNRLTARGRFSLINITFWRWLVVSLPLAACSSGIIFYFKLAWPFYLVSAILLFWPLAYGRFKANHTGYAVSGDFLVAAYVRLFNVQLALFPKEKIQAISLDQSIFMSSNNLNHVEVSLRKGTSEYECRLPYLPAKDAQKISDWYHQQ